MTTLIFDGTWNGLLCCVFEIFDKKLKDVSVVRENHFQPDAFSTSIRVYSNEIYATRVWVGLAKRISKKSMSSLYANYLSEIPKIEHVICAFIRMAFEMEESPEFAFANSTVLRVSQIDKMVHREKHRMEAFVRFQLSKDGLYYATVEPDFNVLPLIARHFKNRYADQRWLIYDLKRNFGIFYDLQNVSEVMIANSEDVKNYEAAFEQDEILYQKLWSEYFKHVNIVERKNDKLHWMHVPKRYWKHLTEKNL